MKRLRLFDRFGFNLPHMETASMPARVLNEYQEWFFMGHYHDWVGVESEQVLSNYSLPQNLGELPQRHIDIITE